MRWNIDCAAADFLARVLGSAEEVAAIGGRSVGDVALAGASAFGVGLPRVLRQPRDGPWGQWNSTWTSKRTVVAKPRASVATRVIRAVPSLAAFRGAAGLDIRRIRRVCSATSSIAEDLARGRRAKVRPCANGRCLGAT